MSTQYEINAHLADWWHRVQQFAQEVMGAAKAEATYKWKRAKFVVRLRAGDKKMSAAQAETEADADDEIHQLYMDRLGSAALVEASKQALIFMRAKSDALRSKRVDERESDKLHADYPGGA